MTSIDEVPLDVWGKLWKKWEKIDDPHDPTAGEQCAMCKWQNEHDGCGCCPIANLCSVLVMAVYDQDDLNEWNNALEDFRALIREEIAKRS